MLVSVCQWLLICPIYPIRPISGPVSNYLHFTREAFLQFRGELVVGDQRFDVRQMGEGEGQQLKEPGGKRLS